jgi:hypothetical protein
MQFLKRTALLISALFICTASFAQVNGDPTSWTYEVQKKSATEYILIFHLDLKKGWHIWSLNPGGDGFQIVPSFNLDKNPNVQVKGKPTEKGKATTVTMDGIDGKVTYLSGKVDYALRVTVKGNKKITGKHTYQVCDDKQCLAPADKDFTFEIK